ncbi:MAG: hypothetical protein LBO69_03165 [Ignavibacteria bacterium]|nr:hypothetical protein [Ignavibacteria bacterium]
MNREQVQNSNNPYDNYGLLHNQALDYFFENRIYSGTSFASYIGEGGGE